MSAIILSGREVRDTLTPELTKRIRALPFTPALAVIQVGDRPDSTSYIKAKKTFADKVGVKMKHIQVPENTLPEPLTKIIEQCNADKTVQGIVVQLPLSAGLDREAVINAIDPGKDTDALTSYSMKRWQGGETGALLPATARGVREIMAYYRIDLSGRQVCVVGRSDLVGKPVAAMCFAAGAKVTVCHSKTSDLAAETRKADVLIVAAGRPGLIGREHVKDGAVVIDIGINKVTGERLEDEIPGTRLVGDVDLDAVKDTASAITPVPGGVGPMTVLALFENLIDLCYDPDSKH